MPKQKDFSWVWVVIIIGLVWWGYSNGFFSLEAPPADEGDGGGNGGENGFQSSPASDAPIDTCTNHMVPPGLWESAYDAHIYCNQFNCPTCYYNNGSIWPKGCMGYPDKGFDEHWNPVIDSQYKSCYCESLV